MKKTITNIICICLSIGCFSSCVAKRKYLAQKKRADMNQTEINALNSKVKNLNDSINTLTATINSMNGRINELGSENQTAADRLNNANNQLNMTKEQIAAQRARLKQMQSFIDQQQKATEGLRKKIADALVGFNSDELTISMKGGRVYISMQENLLFPSGSAVVNPKGKEALAKVAAVLNNNNDINIDIEGHTDSVAIHTAKYPDNWALSVGRATSIAHVLIDDYRVSPTRLVASGRAYYEPVATNSTAAGRGLNRRTEIILEPKLDELMQLLNPGN